MRGEADVKKQVKKLLNKHNFFWWMPPANAYGKAGASDFHALRGGVFIAIETKFGTSRPTALQRAFLGSIKGEHGLAFVVDDRNVEHFERWLTLFDEATAAVCKGDKIPPENGAAMLNCIAALTEKMV